MNKVILKGYITVPENELTSIRDALPAHIAATKSESGCILFEVKESDEEKGRFDVYEEFESKLAFDSHQVRVKNSNWGRITKNVIRNYTIEGIDN